jgi:hypothetical protein
MLDSQDSCCPPFLPPGLFEHPALYTPVIPDVQTSEIPACPQSFSAAC